MKVFMSIDIEGINGICCWDETEADTSRYNEFKQELQREVNAACRGAIEAGATEILIKDAHDSARNLSILDLPKEAKLLRGWEGTPCSMMAGLDESFDAVMFVGYHSASRSSGNSLSHTMNGNIFHVKINGEIASEFTINSLYASYLNVPVAFLSGDLNLTQLVKKVNNNIEVVASKEGLHGAVISKHPLITCEEIEKAGKSISNSNMAHIQSAYEVLGRLIESVNSKESEETEVQKEEVSQIVKAAVEEVIKPLNKRLTSLENGSAKAGKNAEEVTKAEEISQIVKAAVEAALNPVNERLSRVEKAKGLSNQITEPNEVTKSSNNTWTGLDI